MLIIAKCCVISYLMQGCQSLISLWKLPEEGHGPCPVMPDNCHIHKKMRKYYKLSRKLAKAVMPFALRKYERENGKINKTPGGILFFIRDLDPATNAGEI